MNSFDLKYQFKDAVNELSRILKTDNTVISITQNKKRSLNQNSLYWLWLSIIAECTGNDKNDIHEYCKQSFLPASIVKINESEIKVNNSSARLDKKQFTDYLQQIETWSVGELGIILPYPDEK
jgi:hypothetical protein